MAISRDHTDRSSSFVMVRNNPKPLQSDSGPFALKGHLPGLTFAGHMLSAQSNGTNAADVQGSCFAINAASTADATETIRAHPYCKNVGFDPSSCCSMLILNLTRPLFFIPRAFGIPSQSRCGRWRQFSRATWALRRGWSCSRLAAFYWTNI